MFLILVVFAILHYMDIKEFKLDISKKVAIISSWIFFLIINSFYGGALTMFFSTSPDLPFTTIRQGLLKYPTWKMQTIVGEEAPIEVIPLKILCFMSDLEHDLAKVKVNEDPVFAEYWNNMKTDPEELVAANHQEALERLKIGGNFLRTSLMALTAVVAANPKLADGMSLETVETNIMTSMAPLTKHSPYTRLFNMYSRHFFYL